MTYRMILMKKPRHEFLFQDVRFSSSYCGGDHYSPEKCLSEMQELIDSEDPDSSQHPDLYTYPEDHWGEDEHKWVLVDVEMYPASNSANEYSAILFLLYAPSTPETYQQQVMSVLKG